MKTSKIIIISGSVVSATLFCGALYMLYNGVSRFNAAKDELDNSKAILENYYNAPVFPSPENVKKVLKNADQANNWFDDLIDRLAEGNVNSNDRSPSHFINASNKIRRDLIKKARAAGTVLPDKKTNFAFGFERYTGADKALPKSNDVPRLIEQLAIINRISTILFKSGVKEITSVKRDVFERTAGDAAEDKVTVSHRRSSSRSRRGRNRTSSASAGKVSSSSSDVGIIKDGQLYAKMHFVFEFRAKEKALIEIMNAFSTSKMFIVVTSIEISKKSPDLIPAAEVKSDKNDMDRGIFDEPAGDNKDDAPVKPRLGPDYPVCGVKMEIPMDVHLELDVYKFKEAGTDAGH